MRKLKASIFWSKLAAIFFAASFPCDSYAQAPYLEWANAHESGTSWSYAIYTDIFDNTYTTGDFNGTVMVSTITGTDTIASTMGSLSHCFIQKTDSEGKIVWLKAFSSTMYSRGKSVTADSLGNIYVTGFFNGTVDFDPSDSEYLVSTVSEGEIFVTKLNASGELMWAKTMQGSSDICGGSEPNAIELDCNNDLVVTGDFCGTVDFDPGTGTTYKSPAGVFVQKLDTSGTLVWIHTINPTSGDDFCSDNWGNIYVTGTIIGTADFDPGTDVFPYTSTTASYRDVYTLKLDSSGNFKWAVFTSGNDHEYAEGIDVDNDGNVFVLGRFFDTVDFDPGTGVHEIPAIGNQDIFIQKLDSAGNFIWAKNIGGTDAEIAKSIKLDSSANIYLCGHFYNTTDFDPGTNLSEATSNGFTDLFISKLDSSGNFIWGTAIGGISGDLADDIALNSYFSVAITGRFTQTVDFNPNGNTFEMVGSGFTAFVAQYKEGYVSLSENTSANFLAVYPNPVANKLTLSLYLGNDSEVMVELINLNGQILDAAPRQLCPKGTSLLNFDISNYSNGMYVARVYINGEVSFQKFIKQ